MVSQKKKRMQLSTDNGGTPPTVPEAKVGKAPPTVPQAKVVQALPPAPQLPAPQAGVKQAGARRLLRLLGLVAAVVVLVGLAQTPQGRSLLRLTGLARPPASYSTLSFTDPGNLPARVPAGMVVLDVSFGVHNATPSSSTYLWTVQVVHGKTARPAAEGTVTIPQGGTATESRQVSVLCRSGTLEVVVRLAAPAESIHFRAACGA